MTGREENNRYGIGFDELKTLNKFKRIIYYLQLYSID